MSEPSKNGRGSRILRFLKISHAKSAAVPSEEAKEPSIDEVIGDVDVKIEQLQRADQARHEELLGEMKVTQKKVRCAQLRVKRLNGGLTHDEEAELAQEC